MWNLVPAARPTRLTAMRGARRARRCLVALAAAVVLVVSGAGSAEEAPSVVEAKLLKTLDRTVVRVASRGHERAVTELIGALEDLGHDEQAVEKLRRRCDKTLERSRDRPRSAEKEAKLLAEQAREIAAALPALEPADRERVARAVLRIDGSVAEAHEALGRAQRRGVWLDADLVPVLDRRDEIREAALALRKLEFEIGETASRNPSVLAIAPDGGVCVTWKGVRVHSPTIGAERLRRVLTEALRAWTFSNYLETGSREPPRSPNLTFVLLRSKAEYKTVAQDSIAAGAVKKDDHDAVLNHWSIYFDQRGHDVAEAAFEPQLSAIVLRQLFWRQHTVNTWSEDRDPEQPPLHKGHLEWLCRYYLGAEVPSWGFVELEEAGREGGTTDSPVEAERRKWLRRLADTGLAGAREFLRHQARRGEDPKFARTIVERAGRLAGERLLKATFVVEYLHETDEFWPLFKATRGKPPTADTFSEALGHSLARLEERWRTWLLAGERGTSALDLLGPVEEVSDDPVQRAAIDHLDRLRSAAVTGAQPLPVEPGISRGCRLHALYLGLNPDQQSKWPECHEEFSDREGFTPEGVWAGSNSVIMPGSKDGIDAIDGWMGTFYHRLPLLDPRLLAVGWALESEVAVMDSGSLVERSERAPWIVVWPVPGATDVPLRFNPELPNPVPGEDQSAWGYPVTVQLFGRWEERRDLMLELLDAAGKPVPAHVSTPDAPTNPLASPADAWCLIPKAHLTPGAKYTVRVTGWPKDAPVELIDGWSFTAER